MLMPIFAYFCTMSKKAIVTASIVVYNTAQLLVYQAAVSVLSEDVDHLFIIDHSTAGDYAHIAARLGDRVQYVHLPNRGYGAGHNAAVGRAKAMGSDFHAVLNPDVFWKEPALMPLVDILIETPDAIMAAPKIFYPDGRLQYTCKLLPEPLDIIANRFPVTPSLKHRKARFCLEDTGYAQRMNVPFIHGCFLLLRMSAVGESPFDERFFLYGEDVDLSRRLHEQGTTLFCPDVCVMHEHAAASRRNLRMLMIHIVNMGRYFFKWGWFSDSSRDEINRRVLERIDKL